MTVQGDEPLPVQVPQCNNINNNFPNDDAEAGEVGNGEETNANNNEESSQTQTQSNNLSQSPLAKDGSNDDDDDDDVDENLEHRRHYDEPKQIFGIPWSLFVMLMALLAAVTAGTVLAVLYHEPNSNEPNPDQATTLPPSIVVVATTAPSLSNF
jgi:hypothetical protein